VSTVAGSVYAPGFVSGYAAGQEGRIEGVWYMSPVVMGGLQASVSFSPVTEIVSGAAPTATYSTTAYSTALTYNSGPISAVVGFEQNRFADTLINIGGNYNLGVAKIYAGYGQVKGGTAAQRGTLVAFGATAGAYPGAAATGSLVGNGAVKVDTTNTAWSIGAAIPMGAMTIRAGYSSFGSDIANAARDSKLGLGVAYALSKRTFVYSDVASTTRNNNTAGTNPATNNDARTQFDIGLNHNF
jgi:predicted porin